MQAFTVLTGVAAPMPIDNIDTDAISPMAAGKSTSVDLGAMLFNNARYNADGSEKPDFVLNQPRFRKSVILVAGQNFGFGSSRERAVWALMKFGISSVIAPSFADIFYDNGFQNGLLPVIQSPERCASITEWLLTADAPIVTVDLQRCVVIAAGSETAFSVPAERREALLEGLEEIDLILRMQPDIDAFESIDRARRPWIYGSLDMGGR
jgi:3-isopropylmalate/(R)-2-methylmalate dehydratase small subunit